MKPNSFGDGLSYATFSGVSFATYTKNDMKVSVFITEKNNQNVSIYEPEASLRKAGVLSRYAAAILPRKSQEGRWDWTE